MTRSKIFEKLGEYLRDLIGSRMLYQGFELRLKFKPPRAACGIHVGPCSRRWCCVQVNSVPHAALGLRIAAQIEFDL